MQRHIPRILVVDDDVDICCNMRDILDEQGYETVVAHSGLAALQFLKQGAYDVALIDLKMPGMDGASLYDEIKRTYPELVTIMITGYAAEAAVARALDTGIWKVLSKPIDFDSLLALIRQAVAEPLVFVVDDDPVFCGTIWQLLRDQGYRVAVAHGKAEATAKASKAKFQIAIVDLRLSDGNGREVLDAFRTVQPTTRAILITGHRAEAENEFGPGVFQTADAVCFKPLDIQELLGVLQSLCC